MKRALTLLVLLLFCVAAPTAQTKRRGRTAQSNLTPGYYFTVDACRACYYTDSKKELVKLFQEQGLKASIYEGKMMESPNEKFAPTKIFGRSGMWSDVVYVGPFASEDEALGALAKFPVVLGYVQKKRNKMDGAGNEGWPLGENDKVENTRGNDYKYGFYEIKGSHLMQ